MTELHEFELAVRGMHCQSCAIHVEGALGSVEGVRKVEVPSWKSARAKVVADKSVDAAGLAGAVQAAGYSAEVTARKPIRGPHSGGERSGGAIDLLVIGSGSAGFAAAIRGVEMGYKVTMVGAGAIGGTCVNVGCVPSKTLLRAVELYHLAGLDRFQGMRTRRESLDWPQLIEQKDQLVAEMRKARYENVLDGYPGISYIEGRAQLSSSNRVQIEGREYTPGKIVIATGAHAWAPPIPGLEEVGYLDSQAALDLKELPESMIVLGGNAVGLELAQLYARAGTKVTVLELLPRLVPFEDEALSEALTGYLEQEGLQILPGFETLRVESRRGKTLVVGRQNGGYLSIEADSLLVATGRRANTAGFGLVEAGVEIGERGEIIVDEHLRTSSPDIYAAGDVLGRDMFVYVAAYGGALAAENALTGAGRVFDASAVPRVTFTDPQVASVGLTEAEARELGLPINVSEVEMGLVARAQAARDTRGLIKLVVGADDDRLLGAHILAPEAGEMIQTAVLAIRFGLTASDLRETLYPYLTNVEGLKLAALALEKDVALLSCCAG